MESLFILFATGLVIYIIWLIFAIVGDMAEARGHSPWPWWIISALTSPFTAMIILWLFFDLCDDDESHPR